MKSFFKKYKWLLAGLVILLIAAAVIFFIKKKSEYETVKVKRGDMLVVAYAVGTVKADVIFNLKTAVPSLLEKRFVRIGDKVKKGDNLAVIEGFLKKAPFDGLVSAISFEIGELVNPQTPIMTIVDMNSLYLELSMDERVISSIKVGQEARLSFEGQRNVLEKGRVRSIYANAGQFLVLVDFDQKDLTLLPGMTSDVAIQTGLHKNKLLIPLGAISVDGTVLLKRTRPVKIPVIVEATDSKYAAIQEGEIREGDELIIKKESEKVQ